MMGNFKRNHFWNAGLCLHFVGYFGMNVVGGNYELLGLDFLCAIVSDDV